MIERDGAFWAVACDGCSYSEDDIDGDVAFAAVVAELKVRDWRVRKVGGAFEHLCPSCVEDAAAA